MGDASDIVVTESPSKNILTFHNTKTDCIIKYNTNETFGTYKIGDFTCGERGRGNGLLLLHYSLHYLKDTLGKRCPFRLELQAVPSAKDMSLNDEGRLIEYYQNLGFTLMEPATLRLMFGLFDSVLKKVDELVRARSGGRSRKRKTKRKRAMKRISKRRRIYR